MTTETYSGLVLFGDYVAGTPVVPLPPSPSNGDWYRIYNATGGPMTVVAGANINGVAEGFTTLLPEWLMCIYDTTAKWAVRRVVTNMQVAVSHDGTLSGAEDVAPVQYYNIDDVLAFVNTGGDDGLYKRIDNGGTAEWEKQSPFGTTSTLAYASQISHTTGFTLPSTWSDVNLETTDIDGSGSDYTIDLANDRVEFDDTDGSKVYKVTMTGRITFSAKTAASGIRAQLDAATVTLSTVTTTVTGPVSVSFLVKPPTSASNNNYLDFQSNQADAVPDATLDELVILIERVA